MPKFNHPADFQNTFWTITDGDWYVSTIGNDVSGTGSPQNPFLTVRRAFEEALTGEKIIIGPDEYLVVSGNVATGTSGALAPCRLATTTNINFFIGGMFTLDGTLTQEGDRILVWQQNTPIENGIYIVQSGSAWTRADDFNNPENMIRGTLIPVLGGTQYAGTVFQHVTEQTVVVGATDITFESIIAGGNWGTIQGDINAQTDLITRIGDDIATAVDDLRGGVPLAGDTLSKLYVLYLASGLNNIVGSAGDFIVSGGLGNIASNSNLHYDSTDNSLLFGPGLVNNVLSAEHNFIFGNNNSITGIDASVSRTAILGEANNIVNLGPTIDSTINNAYILGGYNNTIVIEDNIGNSDILNVVIAGGSDNSIRIPSGNTYDIVSSFIAGEHCEARSSFTTVMGFNALATGIGAMVRGFDDAFNGLNTPQSPPVLSAGRGAINISSNSTNQSAGNGVLADHSGIFSGIDHHIPDDAPRTVIIGGESINAVAAIANTAYLPLVRIGQGLNATIPDGSASDTILTMDPDGQIHQLPQGSINGLIYPAADGTTGQVITTDGAGNLSFQDVGNVTSEGTPADNQIALWTGDGTIEGDPNLVFQSGVLNVNGNIMANAIHENGGLALEGGALTTTVTDAAINIESNGFGAIRLRTGATPNTRLSIDSDGTFDFLSNPLKNLTDPVDPQDAATMTYVDNAVTGLGSGDVIKVGTPADNQLAVWTGDGTVEGDAALSWSDTNLHIGELVIIQNSRSLGPGTNDGNDNSYAVLRGGGGPGGPVYQTRGSYVMVTGNEEAAYGGDLLLNAGPTGNILLRSGDTLLSSLGSNGNWDFQGNDLNNVDTGTANVNWVVSSDQRLKIIVDDLPDALDIVKNMQGHRFTRNDLDDGTTRVGFMAQQVHKVLPEVVTEDNDTWTMDYGSITAVHNEAIKSLIKEVEALREKVAELELKNQ